MELAANRDTINRRCGLNRPVTVGQLVLAKVKEGPLLLRFLAKARWKGYWDLMSVTGPHQVDVVLEWAAPVKWIEPHILTDEEAEATFSVD